MCSNQYGLPFAVTCQNWSFWQDIAYENLPMLCYQCGRLGHREVHYTKLSNTVNAMSQLGFESHGEQGTKEPEQHHTPWKTVQTKRSRPRGTNTEHPPCGKPPQRDTYTPIHQRGFTASPNSHALNHHQADLVLGQGLERLGKPLGFNRDEMAMHGENHVLLKPCESSKETMQASYMNTCPPFNPINYTSQALHHSDHIRPPTPHGPSQTTLQHTNGSLIRPTILDSHFNRPRSPSNSQPPKQPESPSHSNHAHTFNYPPPPLDQAQEIAILKRIRRSNDEIVSYVHITVHP